MRSIQTIIQRLGYEKSDHLIYQSEYCRCKTISWHDSFKTTVAICGICG